MNLSTDCTRKNVDAFGRDGFSDTQSIFQQCYVQQ